MQVKTVNSTTEMRMVVCERIIVRWLSISWAKIAW